MDDNECEHYLQIEWPLILMIVFILMHYKPKQHQYLSEQMSVRMYIFSDWITKWIDGGDKHRLLSPLLMIYPFRLVRFIYGKWADCYGR